MASQPSLGENEALAKMREEDDLRRKWNEHLQKREDLIGNKKMLETDVERMGYGNMTFSQCMDTTVSRLLDCVSNRT